GGPLKAILGHPLLVAMAMRWGAFGVRVAGRLAMVVGAFAFIGFGGKDQRGDAEILDGRGDEASTKSCDERSEKQITEHFWSLAYLPGPSGRGSPWHGACRGHRCGGGSRLQSLCRPAGPGPASRP